MAMSSVISALPYIQITLSVLLIVLVLVQRSDAEAGSAFGADGGSSLRHTRRGMEKIIFNLTIIVSVLFVASTILALVI